jgi:hypothetical protein
MRATMPPADRRAAEIARMAFYCATGREPKPYRAPLRPAGLIAWLALTLGIAALVIGGGHWLVFNVWN